MKKTLLSSSQLGLPAPVRSLLILALLALRAVVLPAQDTTLAKMPQVELIPVPQHEVMDHYINKVWTSKGWQIKAFDRAKEKAPDRAKESVLHFGQDVLIAVSPNQRYFTVAKPVPNPKGGTMAYDVELRNLSNSILAKGRLSSLGSDGEESDDEFVPADDGLGLLHKANLALSGGLHFVFFERKGSKLLRQFEVDKTTFWNAKVVYEPAQKMIVASFEGHMPDSRVSKTQVQCYSSDGILQWETALDSQSVVGPELFISAFDGTVSFPCRNLSDNTHKNLAIFTKNGKLIQLIRVSPIGQHHYSYFHRANGRQYFISPAEGEYYYIIDTENGEVVNRYTQVKEDAFITGLGMAQGYIIASYNIFHRGKTREVVITERGVAIENMEGVFASIPLNMIGQPHLVSTEVGLFLREQIGHDESETNKFYKIILK